LAFRVGAYALSVFSVPDADGLSAADAAALCLTPPAALHVFAGLDHSGTDGGPGLSHRAFGVGAGCRDGFLHVATADDGLSPPGRPESHPLSLRVHSGFRLLPTVGSHR
jgi:hypothetical protein